MDPGGVANLNGLWDWVEMAPCMGPMSSVRAYSLWAGLCPKKLVKQNIKQVDPWEVETSLASYVSVNSGSRIFLVVTQSNIILKILTLHAFHMV